MSEIKLKLTHKQLVSLLRNGYLSEPINLVECFYSDGVLCENGLYKEITVDIIEVEE